MAATDQAGRSQPRPAWLRWAAPLAALAVLAAVAAVLLLRKDDSSAAAAVTLERASDPGDDPFTQSVAIGPAAEFPGTGHDGNGISKIMKTQQDYLATMKEDCTPCHQLGDKATREPIVNTVEGWGQRILMAREKGDQTVGGRGAEFSANMQNAMAKLGRDPASLKILPAAFVVVPTRWRRQGPSAPIWTAWSITTAASIR